MLLDVPSQCNPRGSEFGEVLLRQECVSLSNAAGTSARRGAVKGWPVNAILQSGSPVHDHRAIALFASRNHPISYRAVISRLR